MLFLIFKTFISWSILFARNFQSYKQISYPVLDYNVINNVIRCWDMLNNYPLNYEIR